MEYCEIAQAGTDVYKVHFGGVRVSKTIYASDCMLIEEQLTIVYIEISTPAHRSVYNILSALTIRIHVERSLFIERYSLLE
jgi:hypothetical protein